MSCRRKAGERRAEAEPAIGIAIEPVPRACGSVVPHPSMAVPPTAGRPLTDAAPLRAAAVRGRQPFSRAGGSATMGIPGTASPIQRARADWTPVLRAPFVHLYAPAFGRTGPHLIDAGADIPDVVNGELLGTGVTMSVDAAAGLFVFDFPRRAIGTFPDAAAHPLDFRRSFCAADADAPIRQSDPAGVEAAHRRAGRLGLGLHGRAIPPGRGGRPLHHVIALASAARWRAASTSFRRTPSRISRWRTGVPAPRCRAAASVFIPSMPSGGRPRRRPAAPIRRA